MKWFISNIEVLTEENEYFRQVLFTSERSQLVVMSLMPGEEIGMEVHDNADQFIRIESGSGRIVLEDEEFEVSDGSAVVVPAGTKHNVINSEGDQKLKLYALYTPPEHPKGTIHQTKNDAEMAEK